MRNKLELICVSLGELTHKQAITACSILPFVEIRVDLLKDRYKLSQLLSTRSKKVITYRKHKGVTDRERFSFLESCVGKVDFIDIEHDAPPHYKASLIKKIKRSRTTKLISSFHDYKKTPDKKILSRFIKNLS